MPADITSPELAYGPIAPLLIVFAAALVGVLVEAFAPRAARRGIRLTPTLLNVGTFPDIAQRAGKFPGYAAHMLALHRTAADHGVRTLATSTLDMNTPMLTLNTGARLPPGRRHRAARGHAVGTQDRGGAGARVCRGKGRRSG